MMKSNKFKIALTALLGLSLSMTSLQAVKIGMLVSLLSVPVNPLSR